MVSICLEATQPAFDLAGRGELVADLDRELRDLVLDVVKDQRAHGDEHPAVLEHRFDLGDQRVIHLQRLDRSEGGFGEQRPRRGDGVDDVGLVQPTRPTLRR